MRNTKEMAREVKMPYDYLSGEPLYLEKLEAFASLVRADALAQHLAVPDAIHHTDTSETLEYIQGWNDCRALMLQGKK